MRDFKEAKHIFLVRFGNLWLQWPAIRFWHAVLADLHQDLAGRNHLASDRRRRGHKLVSPHDLLRIEPAAIDRQVVQPALK